MADSIIYTNGDYYIVKTKKALEVYKNGVTHATRVAIISSTDAFVRAVEWIRRAKAVSDIAVADHKSDA